jgi:hypothetical protein
MPPKRTIAKLHNDLDNVRSELAERDEELAAERTRSARLEAELKDMKTTLDTIATTHIASEKRFAALEKDMKRLSESSRAITTSAPPPQYLAAARSDVQRTPRPPTPTAAPPSLRPVMEEQNTARFVVRAEASSTSDAVQAALADCMGINTSAILLVQKIVPKSHMQAAGPSTSAAGGLPPALPPQVTFIITTSAFVADKAVKGDLRKQLRARGVPMYVDDYLTREEQQERTRRLQEKKDLKAGGITVAWRKATLWKLVSEGDKDVWQLVPAPAAAGGAAARRAAAGGAPLTAPTAP